MLATTALVVAATLAGAAQAAPANVHGDPVKAVSVETLHDFGPGRFIENVALRPLHAGIITTSVNSPNLTLYEFATKQTCTIASFGNSTTAGITPDPHAPDAFFINSNTPVPGSTTFNDIVPGAGRVFRVDLHGATCASLSRALLKPKLVAHVPQSQLLNGAATLAGTNVLAVSDSSAQLIWRIDTATGHVDVLLNDTTTHAPPDPTSGAVLGVNGVRARGPDLFYVNSNTAGYYRLLTGPDGRAIGKPVQLGGLGAGADDFALAASPAGLYYAAGFNNTVAYNDGRGDASVEIAPIAGPTSMVRDVEHGVTVLYVTSTGGDAAYSNPPVTVHGLLSKITLA